MTSATTTGPGRASGVARVLLVLVVALLAAERLRAMWVAAPTDFDDAYMFLRYARNLLDGFGLRWNRDQPPVYGATSLPHLFAVALVRWARPRWDDAAVLQACSRTAALLLVVALVLTCARFARHPLLRRRGWVWGALLVPLLAYGDPFQFHAQTGMDTMLAALANTVLVFAALALAETPSRRRAVGTAAIAYGCYLVRPDNAVYALLVPVLCLGLAGTPGERRQPLLLFGSSLALLVALDLILKQRLLGTPWPLGVYAKRPWHYGGFAGEFTWNPFLFLRVFLAGLWPFLLAVGVFTGRAGAPGLSIMGALLIPVVVSLPMFFAVNQIMGHLGRFFFPATPFIVVAGALGFDRFLTRAADGSRALALAARLAGVALLIWAAGQALTVAGARYEARAATQRLAPLGGYTVTAAHPLPELDSWRSAQEIAALARAAPVGTRFAMSEHGLPGAAAPEVVIIDVLGLHDPQFARAGFRAQELWRRSPDLIWMPHPDHTQMIRDILDSDQLWDHYDLYPDAFSYGVALRRDGPRYPALAALFLARWQASYPGLSLADYRAVRAPP